MAPNASDDKSILIQNYVAILHRTATYMLNSLRPSYVIWSQISWSSLFRVTASRQLDSWIFRNKIQWIVIRNMIFSYRENTLQNVGHFVQGPMCYNQEVYVIPSWWIDVIQQKHP